MVEFDIDEILEEIKDLPYEEKLSFLEDKETDLDELIDELEGYVLEICSLKNEIINKSVLQSLKDAGYPLEFDERGYISFPLGNIMIHIGLIMIELPVSVSFESTEKQLKYRKLISFLLPDFKQKGNTFEKRVAEEDINKCIVDVVRRLMNNKQKFEEIANVNL